MKNTLIDAGPLIALFDKDDSYHLIVKQFLQTFKGKLISTWPVITEATHMLDFNIQVQIDFLKWINKGSLYIEPLNQKHLNRIIELTEKYSNIPMDLADSSLIILAEEFELNEIITIDSDYIVYRTKDKLQLKNLLESFMKPGIK
jgi:predicted nucleic acid-binding protein